MKFDNLIDEKSISEAFVGEPEAKQEYHARSSTSTRILSEDSETISSEHVKSIADRFQRESLEE